MSRNDIVIENARIIFRNFAGKASTYNREGNRTFAVVLQHQDAERFKAEGWNVKYLDPRDEDEEATPYIQVTVSYNNRPPKIVLVSGSNKVHLDESTIEMLDWADIINIDLSLSPYHWEIAQGKGEPPKRGIKAYVATMYVTIEEDPFSEKYGF